MGEIYLHNRKVDSVFQLLGEYENDISYSVAWTLARCPSFCPSNEVKAGKIYRNVRVWCMLDTLFTNSTISEACNASKKRQDISEFHELQGHYT